MLGLMYLGAAALYLLLLIFVVRWAWLIGRAEGGSILKACACALVGFLVVYLPVFWNWVPVVLTHRQLCEEDAGFKAYTSPKGWVATNKGALIALRGRDPDKTTGSRLLDSGFSRYEFFGGVLARETRSEKSRRFGMDFLRTEDRLVDARSNKALTGRVDYSVGGWEDARIWLTRRSCFTPYTAALIQEESFLSALKEGAK